MEYRHEMIDFGSRIPLKLFLHKIGDVPCHLHESLELLYVLQGDSTITINGEKFFLKEEDIILINSNAAHEIHGNNCVIVAIQIKLSKFDSHLVTDRLYFECNSSLFHNKDTYLPLKRIIAKMVSLNTIRNDAMDFLNKSLAYELLYELAFRFKTEPPSKVESRENADRISRIIQYIHQNYNTPITLSSVAAMEYISTAYLSRFFEKNMNINFSDYVCSTRLNYAYNDLLFTDNSIEEIALKNGFPSPRAFVSAFRKVYHTIPSQYRKEHAAGELPLPKEEAHGTFNYLNFEQSSYLSKLLKFVEEEDSVQHIITSTATSHQTIQADMSIRNLPEFPHNFQTFTAVGRASDLLRQSIRENLRTTQSEIGFRFIKFHGLLSDDMMFYTEDKQGRPKYCFTYIDAALDFLMSIQLKPLLQLSFMPKALAKTPDHTLFHREFIISLPKSMERWNDAVKELLLHLIKRYGLAEVLTWPICLWNEPNAGMFLFGFEEVNSFGVDFFDFYKNTFDTVKGIHKDFIFGSTSLINLSGNLHQNLVDYIDYCDSHHCMFDFLNVHHYPMLPPKSTDSISEMDFEKLTEYYNQIENPDVMAEYLNWLRSLLDAKGLSHLPIHITEWNSTSSHRDLVNDTVFKAAYVVKNVLDNQEKTESFGYWSLTDDLEELPMENTLFHGGLGMFTVNQLRKPAYFAFYFLSKLGNELVQKGKNYVITKSNDTYQILLHNFCQFSSFYARGEMFDITSTNRYSPFNGTSVLEMEISLLGLSEGEYMVSDYFVNREHGSVFDKWVEMGAPENLTLEETRFLEVQPGYMKGLVTLKDGQITLMRSLLPLEIRLIILKVIL